MRKSDVLRYRGVIETSVQSVDDRIASTVVTLFGTMRNNGALLPDGTRINWHGGLKRAAVDIWDTEVNNPDNAPSLWEDIDYKDGFRIIPEIITATLAFAEDEYGWWGDQLYRSRVDGNVFNPEVYPDYWEAV